MGGLLCASTPKKIRVHEMAFMGACSEDFTYKNPHLIDAIFERARLCGEIAQIFLAKDEDGDLPIHKACLFGNPTVVQWIIDKWAEYDIDLNIDDLD